MASTLNKLASTTSYVVDVQELLRGEESDKEEMERRWAASAVILKNDAVAIVPATDPVKYSAEDGWLIKVFEDGKFGRRTFWRGASWVVPERAEGGVARLLDAGGAEDHRLARDGTAARGGGGAGATGRARGRAAHVRVKDEEQLVKFEDYMQRWRAVEPQFWVEVDRRLANVPRCGDMLALQRQRAAFDP